MECHDALDDVNEEGEDVGIREALASMSCFLLRNSSLGKTDAGWNECLAAVKLGALTLRSHFRFRRTKDAD